MISHTWSRASRTAGRPLSDQLSIFKSLTVRLRCAWQGDKLHADTNTIRECSPAASRATTMEETPAHVTRIKVS